MSEIRKNFDDLDELLGRLFDRRLAPEDQSRLAELLNDHDARVHYLAVVHLMASVEEWARGTDTSKLEALIQREEFAVIPALARPARKSSSGMTGWIGTSVVNYALFSILFVAIAVVVWSAKFQAHPADVSASNNPEVANRTDENHAAESKNPIAPERANDPVGRVSRLESHVILERDGTKQKATVGTELLARDLLDVPADGSLELTFTDQAHAKLGPRTALTFTSMREVGLREGFVQIDARKRQKGSQFTIATLDAQTRIEGAARLSVGANRKRTQIRVTEGRALSSRRSDGMAVEISEGYYSTMAPEIDPDPRLSRGGTALFVISSESSYSEPNWKRFEQIVAERIIGERLWRSAMPVRVRAYDKLQASDLEDCAIIVLSVFPSDVGVEQKLIDLKVSELPVPIVCLEPEAFPVLGLTGPGRGVDYGFVSSGPLVVDVAAPNHPLAAGFFGTGLDLFAYNKAGFGWGHPATTARTIIHMRGQPEHCTLFAYDQGDSMARGVAPARRVGLFMIPAGADYDSPSFELVDAAIDWCLDSSPVDATAFIHPAAEIVQNSLGKRTRLFQEQCELIEKN